MTQLSIKQGLEMTSVRDNTLGLQKQNAELEAKIEQHKNEFEELTKVEIKLKK